MLQIYSNVDKLEPLDRNMSSYEKQGDDLPFRSVVVFFFVEKEHLNKMFPFPTKRYLVYKTVLLKLYLSWKRR